MAELECLLDAAVEKLLQNSGTEVGPGLSVQALQEENARLKAQLAEVQKVDDEEINRLWSLVGEWPVHRASGHSLFVRENSRADAIYPVHR